MNFVFLCINFLFLGLLSPEISSYNFNSELSRKFSLLDLVEAENVGSFMRVSDLGDLTDTFPTSILHGQHENNQQVFSSNSGSVRKNRRTNSNVKRQSPGQSVSRLPKEFQQGKISAIVSYFSEPANVKYISDLIASRPSTSFNSNNNRNTNPNTFNSNNNRKTNPSFFNSNNNGNTHPNINFNSNNNRNTNPNLNFNSNNNRNTNPNINFNSNNNRNTNPNINFNSNNNRKANQIKDPRNKFNLRGIVKVSGGNEVPPGSFPWQVSIMRGTTHHCGGSIFASDPLANSFDTILTSAHCVVDIVGNIAHPSEFTVLGGTVSLSSLEEEGGHHHVSQVCRVIPHQNYTFSSNHTLNDIAILKLSTPFRKCKEIDAIQVETSLRKNEISKSAYVSGWGQDSDNARTNFLRASKVPIIGNRKCESHLDDLGLIFDRKSQICAGGLGKMDACHGDSGGPLTCKDENDENVYLCGIVSYGAKCNVPLRYREEFPGVYTMPQGYVRWIKENENLPPCSR